jgi:SAM-dependent methyltransferase
VTDIHLQEELRRGYDRRFAAHEDYRFRVWTVLTQQFFQRYIDPSSAVLELGCGWGEFINQIRAGSKYGIDLNPSSPSHLNADVTFFHQDCAQQWPVPDGSLDVVFTSNFFEHLPDKRSLGRTFAEAFRCLRPGGRIICLGPNIRTLPGAYWDFWDHYLPLTEHSMAEGLELAGFRVAECRARFLPYTMARDSRGPIWMLPIYLKMPALWAIFGRQFLVVAVRP